jgi:glycosyltransferase involved in cell wall biosynthesis
MKLSYSGFFNDSSGYGEAARRLVHALKLAGADVRCGEPILSDGGPRVALNDEMREFVNSRHASPDLQVIHAIASDFPAIPRLAHATLGLTCWETTRLPQAMIDGCKSVDKVCVPCEANVNVFAAAGITAGCVPYPTDDGMDMASIPALESMNQPHVFYTVGTRQPRKNFEGTLTAILTATAHLNRDFVAVVVKVGGGPMAIQTAKSDIATLIRDLNLPALPTIHVIGAISDAQMRWLHMKGTCYVTLSRGEGFGLPVLDALSAGREIVSTAWGGVRDLLLAPAGYMRMGIHPIDSKLTPVRQGYPLFSGLQNWAEPDLLQAQSEIRQITATPPVQHVRDLTDYTPARIGHRLLDGITQWISAT